MGAVNVDIKALKTFEKALAKLQNQSERAALCEDCAKELAARMLALVTKRTPVDTGFLRRGWTTSSVTRSGDTYTITVENPVEYAPYVEFGHRVGEAGWVGGRYMMTISAQELEQLAPSVIEKKINAFLQGAL